MAQCATVSAVQCPACAASLDGGLRSWSCPRCGYPVRERPRARIEFEGEAVELLGWLLLAIPATLLVLPIPWFLAAVCRWFCRNLVFRDGTTAEFRGRGGEIFLWAILAVSGGLSIGPRIRIVSINLWDGWQPLPDGFAWIAPVAVGVWLIGTYARLLVIRWCAAKTAVGSGERFRFYGTFWELAGWEILNALAAITIVGWAWTTAAAFRWAARSARSDERALAFHGDGFEILWRSIATLLFSLPIVTIPWALLWYLRWLVGNVTIGGHYADGDD
jgi:hypothetical protein